MRKVNKIRKVQPGALNGGFDNYIYKQMEREREKVADEKIFSSSLLRPN